MIDKTQNQPGITPAAKLTIFVGSDERQQHHSVHQKVMNLLAKMGIKGATVTKGFMSYGSRRQIHSGLNEITIGNLPVIIEAVDEKEKIDRTAEQVIELVGVHGLVQVQPTTIIEVQRTEGRQT